MTTTASIETDNKRGFLIFKLHNEEYGIDILNVQEIRNYSHVKFIANMPDFVKGIMHLREEIIPIVDLRILFHIASAEYNEFTVIIILNIKQTLIGFVVDSVLDVINLEQAQIKSSSQLDTLMNKSYLEAVGVYNERTLFLINPEKLIAFESIPITLEDARF